MGSDMNTLKQQAMQEYFDCAAQNENPQNAISAIHDIFTQDTSNMRLYKYCTVNEYTQFNILHNILHCSQPEKLNDTFDSRPSWSLPEPMSILKAHPYIFQVIQNTMAILMEECTLNDIPIKQQFLVKYCANHAEILNWYLKCIPNFCVQKDDWYVWITVICESLGKHYHPNAIHQYQCCKDLNEALKQYVDLPENQVLSLKNALSIIDSEWSGDDIDALLSIAAAFMLPEESDALVKCVQQIDRKLKQLRQETQVGCLTTKPSHGLMWAHYGNSHQGICIEYDFTDFDFLKHDLIPMPVIYSTKRPKISVSIPMLKRPNNLQAFVLRDCLYKDALWTYENEWRFVLLHQSPDKEQNLQMPPISCIYLGVCISDVHKEIICNLAQQQGIPVKQMKMDRETYELHAHAV